VCSRQTPILQPTAVGDVGPMVGVNRDVNDPRLYNL
jgi:hypothetical protein